MKGLLEILLLLLVTSCAVRAKDPGDYHKIEEIKLLSRSDFGGVYFATFFLNNEPTRLIMDSGSSQLTVTSDLCEAGKCHTQALQLATTALHPAYKNETRQVKYGTADFTGHEVAEAHLCFSKKGHCSLASVLAANSFPGIEKYVDGIVGLSPSSTFLKGFFEGKPKGLFSLNLVDQTKKRNALSSITLGSLSDSLLRSNDTIKLKHFKEGPSWSLELVELKLDNFTLLNSTTPAVLDSGSQQLLLPPASFDRMVSYLEKIEHLGNKSSKILSKSSNSISFSVPCSRLKQVPSLSMTIKEGYSFIIPQVFISTSRKCSMRVGRGSHPSLVVLGDLFFVNYEAGFDFHQQEVFLRPKGAAKIMKN